MTSYGQLATGRVTGRVEKETFTFGFTNFKEATMANDSKSSDIITSYKNSALNRIKQADLDNMFTYHAPVGDQTQRYLELRVAARMLAEKIVDYCPPSADTTAAIRLLSESIMTANASIARGE